MNEPAMIVESAYLRSALYGLLSRALRYPRPEDPQVPALAEAALRAGEAGGDLADAVARLRTAWAAAPPGEAEAEYVRLFSHTVRGDCPPYESEYGETRDVVRQPHELSDVGAFYRAVGLALAGACAERPDHVAVECEYMHFMAYKEAHAEERGDAALAAATREIEGRFLKDHLGRWGPAFFRRGLHLAGDAGVYGPLARLGLALLREDCTRLGVEPGSERLRLVVRTETPDDAFTCGVPAGCPGGPSSGDPGQGGSRGAFSV